MGSDRYKDKFKFFFSFLFVGFGCGLIFLGCFADSLGLGQSHSSSHMGPLEKVCVFTGIVVIVLWYIFRRFAYIIGVNLFILFVLILLLDPILFYGAPWLPVALVARMSVGAQNNYSRIHKGQQRYIPYVKESGCAPSDRCYGDWHGRPNGSGFEYTYTWQYDEYGYRNPLGYFRSHRPDVILIGDSFTEGSESSVTIAEYLRQYWSPWKVYSLGMSNAGPYNWLCQYRRYKGMLTTGDHAKVVFINLCGANDFSLKKASAGGKEEKSLKQEEGIGGDGIVLNPQAHSSRLPFKNEFLMIAEKMTEEAFVKVLLHPKKYALLDKILNSMGIRSDQWMTPVAYYNAPQFDQIDFGSLKGQLAEFAREVAQGKSGAKVILSYIPTRAEICDKSVRDSKNSDCRVEIENQKLVSEKLKKMSRELGIAYIDITSDLKSFSSGFNGTLYMPNGHFTLLGNDLYAQFLMKKAQGL